MRDKEQIARDHDAFKNRLVDEVLGRDSADDKVPMDKVVMLIWQFRDDPSVVTFMARFVAKYAGSRHVFDGIEFYLPQLAHMIIHLEVDWDDAILERFALVIAQQSLHFALQFNWILQGALEDYHPELPNGAANTGYKRNFYTRCLKLLRNLERCVVYGKPRAQELQRLYEKGLISKKEMILLEQADRRFNALQIMADDEDAAGQSSQLDGWISIQMPIPATNSEEGVSTSLHGRSSSHGADTNNGIKHYTLGDWCQRFCVLDRSVLICYTQRKGCSTGHQLDRAFSLEHATIHRSDQDASVPAGKGRIRIISPVHEVRLSFDNPQEANLWFRRLSEEAETSTLFDQSIVDEQGSSSKQQKQAASTATDDDESNRTLPKSRLLQDLTPSQLTRYKFFHHERQFVGSLTNLAEELRWKDRSTRKTLLPDKIAALEIPEMVYLPLCNSSDIWRRICTPLPKEARVFNTKERCPVVMHFLSKRGELLKLVRSSSTIKADPNLDVAEYMHSYFELGTGGGVDGAAGGSGSNADGGMEELAEVENEEAEDEGGDDADEMESSIPKVRESGPDADDRVENVEVKFNGTSTDIQYGDPGSLKSSPVWQEDEKDDPSGIGGNDKATAAAATSPTSTTTQEHTKQGGGGGHHHHGGNRNVQRLLRESVVTMPIKLAKRMSSAQRQPSRFSVMDRQTEMQPAVPILEGSRLEEEADNASIGDGTVVSVERSSILIRDQILYGDLDEGNIDFASIDRAKQFISGGESWAEKSARMLEGEDAEAAAAAAGDLVQLEISSCLAKSHDDLRQEVFVMQMIHFYKSVFAQAKLPLWLKTYRILSTGSSTGLLEFLTDATSLDGLKKADGYPKEGGLRRYFEIAYGGAKSASFKAAQANFMQSLAAYAVVSYLLGLKDRHNGNIMIDTRGHLIFIDFGFALGMAPGHEFSMERAPFKFTKEYVEVMDGVGSECYKEFERLFVAGFREARKNSQIALGLVEIMMFKSNYPCFSGSRYGNGIALRRFEQRLMLQVPEQHVERRARKLIRRARQHWGTYLYDVFQKATNGYEI